MSLRDLTSQRTWRIPWVGTLVAILGVAVAGMTGAQAGAPLYTLSLEWPQDSQYALDIRDMRGGQTGVMVTPALRFAGNNRQTAVLLPDVAMCGDGTSLRLVIDARQPSQAATLTVAREHETIYRQSVSASLDMKLLDLDKAACLDNPNGFVGEITVAVAMPSSGATLSWSNLIREDVGHAWIEFRASSLRAPLVFATAGTYSGLVGGGVSPGINFFREIGRQSDIRKTVSIGSQQLARLSAIVGDYAAQGASAWTPWHNCTDFVTDAWRGATGETLSSTLVYPDAPWEVKYLGFPNTVSLYHSLLAAGGTPSR